MSDTFQCGDSGALVAYLYGECEPGEHAAIDAHVKRCLSCSGEINGLSATRKTLAAWTPPEMALGFQITRSEDIARKARVLERKTPWWTAPLPAWAQAAAALVIFAAGLSTGLVRNGAPNQSSSAQASVMTNAAIAKPVSVSREDLTQVAQQLRTEMAQLKGTPVTPVATHANANVNDDAVLQQVKALIEQSEERQRRDFTLRMVDLASNIETQRRVDLASVQKVVGQTQGGALVTEVRQQREAIDRINDWLVNVSQRTTR
jgi:anti-sigma factor RsiW